MRHRLQVRVLRHPSATIDQQVRSLAHNVTITEHFGWLAAGCEFTITFDLPDDGRTLAEVCDSIESLILLDTGAA